MFFAEQRRALRNRRRRKLAQDRWLDLLQTAMTSMLEYEMDESRVRRAVQKSAAAADEALAEFQARWDTTGSPTP